MIKTHKRLLRNLIILVAALSLNSVTKAQDLTIDLNEKFSLLLTQAKTGNVESIYKLAMLYLSGEGTERNPSEALRLIKISSAKGYYKSLKSMQLFYWKGLAGRTHFLIEPNEDKVKLYTEKYISSLLSYVDEVQRNGVENTLEGVEALLRLGRVYESGLFGLQEDLTKAGEFYGLGTKNLLKIAELGDSEAQLMLWKLYSKGGAFLHKDAVQANYWLGESIKQGNPLAIYNYSQTKTNIHEEEKYLLDAAEKGSVKAMSSLGFLYGIYGNADKKNLDLALYWYLSAYQQVKGGTYQADIAGIYSELGKHRKAIDWYMKSLDERNDYRVISNFVQLHREIMANYNKLSSREYFATLEYKDFYSELTLFSSKCSDFNLDSGYCRGKSFLNEIAPWRDSGNQQ
ncbi:SEL1-like repeat protein [Vibrio kanaloae]|uniref:SEL1-like repeat protein n=1 Tax=Vibrio kanaloae TaxID=170673 RepID=UPI0011B7A896|nr:tetratricopeptide repeat protein [Vibrio kanaloae]